MFTVKFRAIALGLIILALLIFPLLNSVSLVTAGGTTATPCVAPTFQPKADSPGTGSAINADPCNSSTPTSSSTTPEQSAATGAQCGSKASVIRVSTAFDGGDANAD